MPTAPDKITRPLEGCRVGISISESDELSSYGLTPEVINVVTVDLSRRIMALGGSVVLGHDWRTGGVMEAVARFAISYMGQNALPGKPLIINYLPEPERPNLSDSDRVMLKNIAAFDSFSWERGFQEISEDRMWADFATEPDHLAWNVIVAAAQRNPHDPAQRRKLSLTAMRYFLAKACDVRIVLGGKTRGYQGFAPGIVEEAWWQLFLGKRLIVCEGMGGAALGMSRPDSPQARRILTDEERPDAGIFLKAACAYNERRVPLVRVVESLQVEAILRALLPRVA